MIGYKPKIGALDALLNEEERSFKDNALEFITMGHLHGEYGPEEEVTFTPQGGMTRSTVPTGDPGFFQDPVTALGIGAATGARASAGVVGKLATAARESLGWFTGGASDVPTLVRAGTKAAAKAASTKPLAEAAARRQAKGVLESITPEARVSAGVLDDMLLESAGTAPKISSKAVGETKQTIQTEQPAPTLQEAGTGTAIDPPISEIVQPAATSKAGTGRTANTEPPPGEVGTGLTISDINRSGKLFDTGMGKTGLQTLADEQAVQNTRGSVGLNISEKTANEPLYTFESPETEYLFKQAKGIKPEPVSTRLKAITTEIGHKLTRDFEHLANKKENAELIFSLKRLEKQKDVVADRTVRSIGETISGLNKSEYDLFSRKVIVDDLKSDFNRGLYPHGNDMPFKFTPESLLSESGKIDAAVSVNQKVNAALAKRKQMMEQVKTEYIDALSPYKPGVEDMFRDNYYRHQVLDYVADNGIFGTGKRLKTPYKGYMKGRCGVANLYNTDYIEAEHNIMAQMLHDIETAKTLTTVKGTEDISSQVRTMAKNNGMEDWHEAIPDGYTVWQPREGNVFYPVLTVSEKTAEKIMAQEMDELLDGGGKIFGDALAVGGKRKEWVVRNEVADTLNNLVRERAKGLTSTADLSVMTAWKKWQLISPRRVFKYNARNLTGDAEAVFLGNPRGFSKTWQSITELGNVYFGKKSMSPEMKAWFERGGMSSTLQAQEMDSLKQMWMFSRLYNQGSTNLWQKYWNAARVGTDFRESILRYANFLDYREQLMKNGGKPLNYGASKPEMIDGLASIDDKAYWLSNDLLGAYDRVSLAGQTIRERLIPFWSWQEVNFKRYIQLAKNAANNNELTSAIGKKLGATTALTAAKIGGLAVKAAAFSSMLAVYNHTFFPEEESKLPPDVRIRAHIITGTDNEGNIEYFNRMGTLDDFISWFGLDYSPRFINDYLSGRHTLKESLQHQAEKTWHAPINKVVGGAAPFMKLGSEIITKRSTFPDIFKPGTIRDNYLHIARSFGLENEYIAMAGKPSRGYKKSLKGLFVYTVSPGESAYRQAFDMRADFLKKTGRTSEGFWLTPTGDALYNMKLAIKYEDKQAFSKYFNLYIDLAKEQGRTPQETRSGIRQSILSMHPLYNMNDKTTAAFINSLNKEDQDTLVDAIKFYKETLAHDVGNNNE